MDRLLYIASNGANQVEQAQALHANNLANASTGGFKADLARVEERALHGDGYDARSYGKNTTSAADLSPGLKRSTGRDLDIAMDRDGFIAVLLPDGREAYTRDGALQIDSVGRLTTHGGYPVVGDAGPIALPPYDKVLVGSDGTITVQPEGQPPSTLVQADRIKLVDPDPVNIQKALNGLFVRPDELIEQPNPNVEVVSGFLESSNVNAVGELTAILGLSRQFEIEVRLMRTAQENDESASQLLRIG